MCDIITRTHLYMLSITQVGYTPLITAAHYDKYGVVIELLTLGDYDAQNNVSHYHLIQ